MNKHTIVPLRQPVGPALLSTLLRKGAPQLIAEALQTEFEEFLSQCAGHGMTKGGRRRATRRSSGGSVTDWLGPAEALVSKRDRALRSRRCLPPNART